jgi:arsenate reductase
MTLTLWHNPRCTKSRQTLALLQDQGQTPEIRLYLTDPPSVAELKTLHRQLARPVIAFVRTQEAAFKEAGLSRSSDDTTLIAAIAKHPILLERPILVAGERAEIGRPPEAILTLL